MKLSVFRSDRLIEAAAAAFSEAITEHERCTLALSRPPRGLLPRLVVDWSSVEVFQADERVAPDSYPERNLTLIERDVPRPIHAMPVTEPDLEDAARRYGAELEAVCGSPPVLDVVHLGLGPDGHTASLLPGDPVLDVRDRWVAITREDPGYRRMTLTYPVLDAARVVIFVVSGEQKADALARVLNGDMSLSAARLQARDVRIFADDAAASRA